MPTEAINKDFLNECLTLSEIVNSSAIEQAMPYVKHGIKGFILSGQRYMRVNKAAHTFSGKQLGAPAIAKLLEHLKNKEGFEIIHDPPGQPGYADIKW